VQSDTDLSEKYKPDNLDMILARSQTLLKGINDLRHTEWTAEHNVEGAAMEYKFEMQGGLSVCPKKV